MRMVKNGAYFTIRQNHDTAIGTQIDQPMYKLRNPIKNIIKIIEKAK